VTRRCSGKEITCDGWGPGVVSSNLGNNKVFEILKLFVNMFSWGFEAMRNYIYLAKVSLGS